MTTATQTAARTVISADHPTPNGNGSHDNGHATNRLTPHHLTPDTPHSTPDTPQLSPDKLALTLAAFLNGNLSLIQVCEDADISLSGLYAWAQSEWAQQRFEMIRQLSKLRDELIAADAVPQARQVLVHLATIAEPVESASSRECRRKSATGLLLERAPRSAKNARKTRTPGGRRAPDTAPSTPARAAPDTLHKGELDDQVMPAQPPRDRPPIEAPCAPLPSVPPRSPPPSPERSTMIARSASRLMSLAGAMER